MSEYVAFLNGMLSSPPIFPSSRLGGETGVIVCILGGKKRSFHVEHAY
jgi:hypothetical protein